MRTDVLDELADELVLARDTGAQVTAPSRRRPGLSLADAYGVARRVDAAWAAAGHIRNGVKIGLTCTEKWDALRVSAPFWGATYQDTTSEAAAGPFNLDPLLAPRLEAEIVLGLSRALRPGATVPEVVEAVAWAALGFEIVDSHVPGWDVTPADLVADFGAHAGVVLGERRELAPQELMDLASVVVELTCPGRPAVAGRGTEVAGGPVQAVAAVLGCPDAVALPAGSIISTGSLTGGAHAVEPGDTWRIDADGAALPPVTATFTGRRDDR